MGIGKTIALIKALGGGNGGGGGSEESPMFIVSAEKVQGKNQFILDKTFNEIADALRRGKIICMAQNNPGDDPEEYVTYLGYLSLIGANHGVWGVAFVLNGVVTTFTADSPDGYPESEVIN